MEKKNYKILGLTLTISFIIMYLVMFLNVSQLDHIYISYTRFYMAVLMIAPMAVLMLLMMKSMFKDKTKNILILISSISVFILALTLLRTQTPINDVQYMKAMIPHHSSAILTSTKSNIKDPEVKKLAAEIIEAQEREIKEMKRLIEKLN